MGLKSGPPAMVPTTCILGMATLPISPLDKNFSAFGAIDVTRHLKVATQHAHIVREIYNVS